MPNERGKTIGVEGLYYEYASNLGLLVEIDASIGAGQATAALRFLYSMFFSQCVSGYGATAGSKRLSNMRPERICNSNGILSCRGIDNFLHVASKMTDDSAVIEPVPEYLAELDRRLVAATRDIRLLTSLSWPAHMQQTFLAGWDVGRVALPQIDYPAQDLAEARVALAEIAREAPAEHPVGEYLRRSAESWGVAAQLIECAGSAHVSECSIQLFGRPGDRLPGSDSTNLDAARHFIAIADELGHDLVASEADYCIPADILREDLQAQLDDFFGSDVINVVTDANLIAKAAAGATRIRLRSATCFTEDDRHQLLEHEAFVHSLTALNGRTQPNLASFGRSSPRVTATQEGLAVFAELMSGSIDIQRLKRISLRILAIDMALAGADFIEVFRYFLASGQTEADSFTSSQRVFRGVPLTGGTAFTKDAVYLHGLLSIDTFFRWALRNSKLNLTRNLFAGKLALHDVISLEPYFDSGYITQPLRVPPWAQHVKGLAGTLAFSLFANHIHPDRIEAEDLVLGF